MSRYRKLPLGELILNSIDRDGTGLDLTNIMRRFLVT